MLSGKVFDIQRYSVNDGPGIRTTVFLKGCPLRCPWCHSPESQSFDAQLALKRMACRGLNRCTQCTEVCEKAAINQVDFEKYIEGELRHLQIPDVNENNCGSCFDCTRACPSGALYVCGTDMTVSEVLATVTKDMEYYRKSGGGLTISGGEPLCQSEFCAELAKATKAENITVAIDTSGFVNWNAFERVLPYADLFLLDIKHVSDEKHKRVVGVSNELILQNAKKLAASGSSIWIRVPVIPQFNDSDADSRAIAEFIGGLGGGVEQVQVLPYHNLGTYKYERIFWRKPIFEAPTHKDERIHEILEIYKSSGVETRLH